jgi:hypothetical protein
LRQPSLEDYLSALPAATIPWRSGFFDSGTLAIAGSAVLILPLWRHFSAANRKRNGTDAKLEEALSS